MKLFPILLLSLLCCTTIWAQTRKQLEEVTERTLLVVLDEVRHDLKAVRELAAEDPQRIEAYQDSITRYNQRLQEMVLRYWRFHDPEDIRFVTRTELNAIPEDEEEQYVLLIGFDDNPRLVSHDHISVYYVGPRYVPSVRLGLYFKEDFHPRKDGYISIVTPYHGNDITGSSEFAASYLDRGAMFRILFGLQLYIERILYRHTINGIVTDLQAHQHKLTSKKLVVLESRIKEKKLSKQELRRAYPYEVAIVNKTQYSKLLATEADQCVFLVMDYHPKSPPPFSTFYVFHYLIDGADGQLLGMSPTKRSQLIPNYTFQKYWIKEKNVRDYVKFLK